ncbi:LuxR C-terminal-related transcriptional regulator [Methyloraptor flagellatus]|uniref:LuxR C-terminal-related transcriptional regulator n=1 Tax=Methyloraptor flagellatus TaxID=3162530 RepID=A0AAU7X5N2_9HYPH
MDGTTDWQVDFDEARAIASVADADQVLDRLERRLRQLGATHLLVTGLPLPGRTMAKLIVRMSWPDRRSDGYVIDVDPADPLLLRAIRARAPLTVKGRAIHSPETPGAAPEPLAGRSDLVEAAGPSTELVVFPVHLVHPFQGCVIIGTTKAPVAVPALAALSALATCAFRRLIELGRISSSRPGDLSERERRVLELTAIGKTAGEIADLLKISQRTVHAHLQNASEKLNASNKTHTVVEAIRYGQINL